MSFSSRAHRGMVRALMPASTRAITALFLLLVAAGHQTRQCAVEQVQAAWLAGERSVERSARIIGVRPGPETVVSRSVSRPGSVPTPGLRRHRVLAGDLPAPRAPNA
jgi:hypothetical protein